MLDLLLEKSIKELNSSKDYSLFLNQFPVLKNPSRSIEIGQMYSCDNYDFDTKYPLDKLNNFDKKPLQLVFNKTDTHYYTLNLHFVPVLMRSSVLRKIQNLNPVQFKKDSKFRDIKIKISYAILRGIFSKCPVCVRCYRYDRINNLRKIPIDKWTETANYSPNTFKNSNMERIIQQFKSKK